MADDLDALLTAAGIPGPYVLAPTSFGPWVTRIYDSQHPEQVAGLVFIDPVPVDLEARWKAVLPPELSARWIEDDWNGNPEEIDFAASATQLAAANPLPDVPLRHEVLSTTGRSPPCLGSASPSSSLRS